MFLESSVVTEAISVIGHVNDVCVLPAAAILEHLHQPADVLVQVPDRVVIGGVDALFIFHRQIAENQRYLPAVFLAGLRRIEI